MTHFPLAGVELDRKAFANAFYPANLREGAFRDALLAATPSDLEASGDGGYTYQALVTYDEEGEAVEGGGYESAILFTFRPDGSGSWQLAEVWFAG
jgi:hypothetical protein